MHTFIWNLKSPLNFLIWPTHWRSSIKTLYYFNISSLWPEAYSRHVLPNLCGCSKHEINNHFMFLDDLTTVLDWLYNWPNDGRNWWLRWLRNMFWLNNTWFHVNKLMWPNSSQHFLLKPPALLLILLHSSLQDNFLKHDYSHITHLSQSLHHFSMPTD